LTKGAHESRLIDMSGAAVFTMKDGSDAAPYGENGAVFCSKSLTLFEKPGAAPRRIADISRIDRWVYCSAFSDKHAILTTNYNSSTAASYNAGGRLLWKRELPFGARYSLLDEKRGYYFVSNYLTGEFDVIDANTGNLPGTAFCGRRVRWLHMSPDGNRILFAASSGLYEFDIDLLIAGLNQ